MEKTIVPILEQKIIPPKVEVSKNVIPMIIYKWINPSLEYPNISTTKFVIVDKITTKYYVVIRYNFTGKPVYCRDWEKHFSSDIVNQMEGTKVTLNKIVKHWDLVLASFIFNNNNNAPIAQIQLYTKNSNINDDDIKVIINNNITLVLRPVTCQIVNDLKYIYDDTSFCKAKRSEAPVESDFVSSVRTSNNQLTLKYNIISNLRFVTHFTSQINIYKNKNILDPNKTWTLHLILNEKQMGISN